MIFRTERNCLAHIRGRTYSVPVEIAGGLAVWPGWDLVVDLVRGRLVGKAGEVTIGAMDLVRGLLELLIAARGEPVSVRAIHEQVWRARWIAPEYHQSAIHVTVGRIRRALERAGAPDRLIAVPGHGYAFRMGERCLALTPAPSRRRPARGLSCEAQLLEVVRECGAVDNRALRRRTRLSRSTIYRELKRLVEQGALVAQGKGRAVRYALAR